MNWNLYFQNDRMTEMLSNNFEQQKAQEEKIRAQELAQIEKNSANALREKYVRNQQMKTALPQQVAMLGAGGVSESAQIAIESDYGEGRNRVYHDKQNAESQANLEANNRIAKAQGDYQQRLANWQEQRARLRAEEQRYREQLSYRREQDEYRKQQDEYRKQQDELERKYQREQNAQNNKYKQEQFEYKKKQDALKKKY